MSSRVAWRGKRSLTLGLNAGRVPELIGVVLGLPFGSEKSKTDHADAYVTPKSTGDERAAGALENPVGASTLTTNRDPVVTLEVRTWALPATPAASCELNTVRPTFGASVPLFVNKTEQNLPSPTKPPKVIPCCAEFTEIGVQEIAIIATTQANTRFLNTIIRLRLTYRSQKVPVLQRDDSMIARLP